MSQKKSWTKSDYCNELSQTTDSHALQIAILLTPSPADRARWSQNGQSKFFQLALCCLGQMLAGERYYEFVNSPMHREYVSALSSMQTWLEQQGWQTQIRKVGDKIQLHFSPDERAGASADTTIIGTPEQIGLLTLPQNIAFAQVWYMFLFHICTKVDKAMELGSTPRAWLPEKQGKEVGLILSKRGWYLKTEINNANRGLTFTPIE